MTPYQWSIHRTTVVHRNLNPHFDETFTIGVFGDDDVLAVNLYDWDAGGNNDFLGCTSVPIKLVKDSGNKLRVWLPLRKSMLGHRVLPGESRGAILLDMTYVHGEDKKNNKKRSISLAHDLQKFSQYELVDYLRAKPYWFSALAFLVAYILGHFRWTALCLLLLPVYIYCDRQQFEVSTAFRLAEWTHRLRLLASSTQTVQSTSESVVWLNNLIASMWTAHPHTLGEYIREKLNVELDAARPPSCSELVATSVSTGNNAPMLHDVRLCGNRDDLDGGGALQFAARLTWVSDLRINLRAKYGGMPITIAVTNLVVEVDLRLKVGVISDAPPYFTKAKMQLVNKPTVDLVLKLLSGPNVALLGWIHKAVQGAVEKDLLFPEEYEFDLVEPLPEDEDADDEEAKEAARLKNSRKSGSSVSRVSKSVTGAAGSVGAVTIDATKNVTSATVEATRSLINVGRAASSNTSDAASSAVTKVGKSAMRLSKLGYDLSNKLTDSAKHGVSQAGQRLHFTKGNRNHKKSYDRAGQDVLLEEGHERASPRASSSPRIVVTKSPRLNQSNGAVSGARKLRRRKPSKKTLYPSPKLSTP